MLELIDISKIYGTGETSVRALNGANIKFRKNEFVSILGPSGCGKTTLLNIVGGLDRYTDGDLLIRGRSTKQFKAYDWDAYRNNCVGFVFQNYNLIPHQSVLGNVELALTLSGVSRAERKKKAANALEKVGLGDQKHKRPNQLSGGQMQRVAIARAIVNDPEIVLADEPTGALDSETSVQVIDLLKEIAKDRLVIMVTHNNELAGNYSTRIIKLFDGVVVGDSNPLSEEEEKELRMQKEEPSVAKAAGRQSNSNSCIQEAADAPLLTPRGQGKETKKSALKRTSMSFFTALNLSLKNLLTKKGRSIIVSFAGSIGIIGIALVLAISNGFKVYIKKVEAETLANFPVSIARVGIDIEAMYSRQNQRNNAKKFPKDGNSVGFYERQSLMDSIGKPNNITQDFVDYVEELKKPTSSIGDTRGQALALDVQKIYSVRMPLLTLYEKTNYVQFVQQRSNSGSLSNILSASASSGAFTEMMDNADFISKQYDMIYGEFPSAYNEIVLIVDTTNSINKDLARNLGFNEMLDQMDFDSIVNKKSYKIILNDLYYSIEESTGEVKELERADSGVLRDIFQKGEGEGVIELKISGIMRARQDAVMAMYGTGLAYLPSLTEVYLESCVNAPISVLQQNKIDSTDAADIQVYKALFSQTEIREDFYTVTTFYDELIDALNKAQGGVFLSLPKPAQKELIKAVLAEYEMFGDLDSQAIEEFVEMFVNLGDAIDELTDDEQTSFGIAAFYFKEVLENGFISLDSVKKSVMQKLGVGGLPSTIYIYPQSFEAKSKILAYLAEWNLKNPDNQITPTDPAEMLSGTLGQMIDIISYVLAAFAGVALVVSSIMIGIITYVSVIERTKEIGVLRSIGARKKDVARVFNAETIIIGLVAGLMGVLIAYILCIPINLIITSLAGTTIVGNLAVLNPLHALALVCISALLTFTSGLIPALYASKRDPVVALRSE